MMSQPQYPNTITTVYLKGELHTFFENEYYYGVVQHKDMKTAAESKK